MPTAHFIEGDEGCAFAREQGCVAVVVDALRASATAAALLHQGARRLLVAAEVADARAAKEDWPDALFYGERGGLPPEGFDYGNSPAEAVHAKGRDVIFTTTNGARRMVQCWGAAQVVLGTTVNAGALRAQLCSWNQDVVFIPAGLVGHPDFDAQEDRAAAAYLAARLGWPLGAGADACATWRARIDAEGLEALFANAPHAQALRDIGMHEDIARCAAVDRWPAVPVAVEQMRRGVLVH